MRGHEAPGDGSSVRPVASHEGRKLNRQRVDAAPWRDERRRLSDRHAHRTQATIGGEMGGEAKEEEG